MLPGFAFAQEAAGLGHQDEAVLHGDPKEPDDPDQEDTFQVLPARRSARMPPTRASGSVARMTERLGRRAQGQVQQDEDGKRGQGDGHRQRAGCLLAL